MSLALLRLVDGLDGGADGGARAAGGVAPRVCVAMLATAASSPDAALPCSFTAGVTVREGTPEGGPVDNGRNAVGDVLPRGNKVGCGAMSVAAGGRDPITLFVADRGGPAFGGGGGAVVASAALPPFLFTHFFSSAS